jgi:hypothetical protein
MMDRADIARLFDVPEDMITTPPDRRPDMPLMRVDDVLRTMREHADHIRRNGPRPGFAVIVFVDGEDCTWVAPYGTPLPWPPTDDGPSAAWTLVETPGGPADGPTELAEGSRFCLRCATDGIITRFDDASALHAHIRSAHAHGT